MVSPLDDVEDTSQRGRSMWEKAVIVVMEVDSAMSSHSLR